MTFKRISDELNYNITVYNILENIYITLYFRTNSFKRNGKVRGVQKYEQLCTTSNFFFIKSTEALMRRFLESSTSHAVCDEKVMIGTPLRSLMEFDHAENPISKVT